MALFAVTIELEQMTYKTVSLLVEAKNKNEAASKAETAVITYPNPVFEEGVNRIVTIKSSTDIPSNIIITSVEKV
jgi:hypothetical protein